MNINKVKDDLVDFVTVQDGKVTDNDINKMEDDVVDWIKV